MLVDSHCHLDYFTDAEVDDILSRATYEQTKCQCSTPRLHPSTTPAILTD